MAFDPAFLDELRMRVPLADVVGRRVKLVKKGREHSGLCPFHNEKTPSFTVNEDKGFFHCFGCGAHGDVIGFVMRTENLPFPEAIEKLANEAGLQLPMQTRQSREEGQVRQSLHAVLEAAAKWFSEELHGPRGQLARDYLQRRGMTKDTIEQFRIGFAPDARGALKIALLKQGFKEAQLYEVGLLRRRDDGGETYDFFRNRIIFPITDRRERVIAFGGRVLDPAPPNAPKYLNSPETTLFHKGRNLYGLAQAIPLARQAGRLVVAEGYMDAIALLVQGIAAVAPLGTALTEEQLSIIWKVVPEPLLCFDGDAAGQRAATRAANTAIPLLYPGNSLYFLTLPAKEDPDSYIRKRGRAAFEELMQRAEPLSAFIWKTITLGRLLDTPERMAALEQDLRGLTSSISNAIARTFYSNFFRQKVWGQIREQQAKRFRGVKKRKVVVLVMETIESSPDALGVGVGGVNDKRERTIIATILNHPSLIHEFDEALAALHIYTPEFEYLRSQILSLMPANDNYEAEQLKTALCGAGFAQSVSVLTGGTDQIVDLSALPGAPIEAARMTLVDALRQHRVQILLQEVEELASEFAREFTPERWERFVALKKLVEEESGASLDLDEVSVLHIK